MKRYSLTHLTNDVLRRELSDKAAKEQEATAELLAHIAEFDARKLYLPSGYESMFAYCVRELGLSEEATKKRVWVARTARRCPAVLEALATGRVHLSGLVALTSYLSPENAEGLLAEAAHKTRVEIERFLAARFPRPEMPPSVSPIPAPLPSPAAGEEAPGSLGAPQITVPTNVEGSPGNPRARVSALSPEAFAVQFTRNREADERFRYLQDLLGRAVARGDIAEVYDRAVKELIAKLERVRFGACSRPRAAGRHVKSGSRHIPAHVKRAVWQRDGGQCTFVGETGRRCEARGDVEIDHVTEFARGGEATVDGLRLRCRAHNQYTAERTFGAEFMRQRRAQAAEARAVARAAAERARAEKAKQAAESRLLPHELEVIPWLRQLGCREDEWHSAARRCRDMAEASLEDRVKRALSWFGARCGRTVKPVAAGEGGASFVTGSAAMS